MLTLISLDLVSAYCPSSIDYDSFQKKFIISNTVYHTVRCYLSIISFVVVNSR